MFLAVHTGIDETKALIQDSLRDLKLPSECEDQKHEATSKVMMSVLTP